MTDLKDCTVYLTRAPAILWHNSAFLEWDHRSTIQQHSYVNFFKFKNKLKLSTFFYNKQIMEWNESLVYITLSANTSIQHQQLYPLNCSIQQHSYPLCIAISSISNYPLNCCIHQKFTNSDYLRKAIQLYQLTSELPPKIEWLRKYR